MSRHKNPILNLAQRGFTIVELTVVILLVGIISTFAFTFFNTSTNQYLALQQDADSFNGLASHYQRLANVLRGLTDITAASANEITLYAYFSPNDAYVSLIRYYIYQNKMLADVTPLTSNPPNGTLITSSQKTYTIINNFYSTPGVDTFVYLDSSGSTLALPISDLHTIKGLTVNLAVPSKSPSNTSQALTLQVSLRNRKTNL